MHVEDRASFQAVRQDELIRMYQEVAGQFGYEAAWLEDAGFK
jgi:hypothetical protein